MPLPNPGRTYLEQFGKTYRTLTSWIVFDRLFQALRGPGGGGGHGGPPPADETGLESNPPRASLSPLTIKHGNLLPRLTPSQWVEVDVTADSGACETVMPPSICQHVEAVPSEQSKAGVEYEVANGQAIPNLGKKELDVLTEGSNFAKRIDFHVSEVHKPLLALGQVADMGYRSVLERGGGYLEDEHTGERIPMRRDGHLYMLRLWVRQAAQAQGFGNGKLH